MWLLNVLQNIIAIARTILEAIIRLVFDNATVVDIYRQLPGQVRQRHFRYLVMASVAVVGIPLLLILPGILFEWRWMIAWGGIFAALTYIVLMLNFTPIATMLVSIVGLRINANDRTHSPRKAAEWYVRGIMAFAVIELGLAGYYYLFPIWNNLVILALLILAISGHLFHQKVQKQVVTIAIVILLVVGPGVYLFKKVGPFKASAEVVSAVAEKTEQLAGNLASKIRHGGAVTGGIIRVPPKTQIETLYRTIDTATATVSVLTNIERGEVKIVLFREPGSETVVFLRYFLQDLPRECGKVYVENTSDKEVEVLIRGAISISEDSLETKTNTAAQLTAGKAKPVETVVIQPIDFTGFFWDMHGPGERIYQRQNPKRICMRETGYIDYEFNSPYSDEWIVNIHARLSAELCGDEMTSTVWKYASDVSLLVNGEPVDTKTVIPDDKKGRVYTWRAKVSPGVNKITFVVAADSEYKNGLTIYADPPITIEFMQSFSGGRR